MNKKEYEVECKKAQFLVTSAMDDITKATKKVLQDYVHNQYLISFAKVIAYLGFESEESQDLLEEMDYETREKVKKLSKDFKKSDETVTKEIDHIVTASGINLEPDFQIIKDNILATGKTFADDAIYNFKSETPVFTRKIEDCLFDFADIKYLDNLSMQKILRELDQQELAIALKGADTEVQDKFFTNMSTRAATMLKEDMEFLGTVPVHKVEECQNAIVKVIFRLADIEEILII